MLKSKILIKTCNTVFEGGFFLLNSDSGIFDVIFIIILKRCILIIKNTTNLSKKSIKDLCLPAEPRLSTEKTRVYTL